MRELILGIDTSNYKTSVAVTDENNDIIFQRSEYLEVPQGKRGLRQSECFFRHSNAMPDYISEVFRNVNPGEIRAIGVSSRPRRVEGSYMPCFLAGLNTAKQLASALEIPVYEFSHQEGHAAAIIEYQSPINTEINPAEGFSDKRSILFHLSGGTTEFLLCSPDSSGYDLEIIGGTKDISIGQLIDRAGVAMGLPFPAGMFLDEMASSFKNSHDPKTCILPKIRLENGYFNLSGAETKLLRTIESTVSSESIESNENIENIKDNRYEALASELFDSISKLLTLAASELSHEHDVSTVYMAGGVSSSSYIRKKIERYKQDHNNSFPKIVFGEPALSGDNAAGTAFLAGRLLRKKTDENSNRNTGK